MHVRLLTASDAAALRVLRLRALREHPDAFGSSAEEEEGISVAAWAERIAGKGPGTGVVGAFDSSGDGARLVGLVGFVRETRRKLAHKAWIWGMYVAPEARGASAGRALFDAALDALRACDGVEIVTLSVVIGNEAARALYASKGFEPFALERDAMKVHGRYLDEESMALRLRPRASS